MSDLTTLTLADAEALCTRALAASNTSSANARSTAKALVRAEADGQHGHGLSRVPSYAAQAASRKVDGMATPTVERVAPALLRVDAASGFAYPAIDLVCESLPVVVRDTGVAAAAIHNSHHLGQAGAHAERLADDGLVAIVLTNSPKAITFWGGSQPMMGTNPIAFAAPRGAGEPLVIDMSLSKVARGKVLAAKRAGDAIPDSWALDAEGNATTDPEKAMHGSMLPIGDAKGAALVLMVEILTAALTGSQFGYEASSFFDAEGKPPHVGHLVIVFDPERTSGGSFGARIDDILGRIEETDGARIPGTSRLASRARAAAEGLEIPAALYAEINSIVDDGDG